MTGKISWVIERRKTSVLREIVWFGWLELVGFGRFWMVSSTQACPDPFGCIEAGAGGDGDSSEGRLVLCEGLGVLSGHATASTRTMLVRTNVLCWEEDAKHAREL